MTFKIEDNILDVSTGEDFTKVDAEKLKFPSDPCIIIYPSFNNVVLADGTRATELDTVEIRQNFEVKFKQMIKFFETLENNNKEK
jgi:hypothetical protein